MSILSKLFGGGGSPAPKAEPELYEGFSITPTPIKEGPRYRISAQIEKDGRSHTLIRADTLEDLAMPSSPTIIDQIQRLAHG